jgi:hypothetical protein
METQAMFSEETLQPSHELSAEHFAEHAYREKEPGRWMDPMRMIGGDAAGRNDAVDVRVMLLLFGFPPSACSYSVLSNEAIIDSLWLDSIQPVLIKRFPQATEEQLKEAHAYTYGGCIIQDLGYYPFGSHFPPDARAAQNEMIFLENFVAELWRKCRPPSNYNCALPCKSTIKAPLRVVWPETPE